MVLALNSLLMVAQVVWMLVGEPVDRPVVVVEVQRYSVAPETVIGSVF